MFLHAPQTHISFTFVHTFIFIIHIQLEAISRWYTADKIPNLQFVIILCYYSLLGLEFVIHCGALYFIKQNNLIVTYSCHDKQFADSFHNTEK
jgi:hypothetical protein